MKSKLLMLALAAGLWSFVGQAQAEVITIQISGEIDALVGNGIPGSISEDSVFEGVYTYDSSALDSDPMEKCGQYVFNSPYGLSISLGGYQFETASTHEDGFLVMIDNLCYGNRDYYALKSSENATLSNGTIIEEISWFLGDSTATTITSADLPTTAPNLADWDYNSFKIISEGYAFTITGTVTSVVLVPEPLTVTLLAIGFCACNRKRN